MKVLVSDLVPGTEYELQFRTNDGEAVSDWSPVYSVTTVAQTNAPAIPTGAEWGVVNTSNTFRGTWDEVTQTATGKPLKNLSHYLVEIDDNDGTSVDFQTKNLKFTFTSADQVSAFGSAKAQLGFKVCAVNNAGNAGSFTTRILSGKPAPAAPTGLTAVARTGGVSLNWTAVAELDIAGYRVYASTTAGFTPGPSNLYATVTGTSYNFITATFTGWYFKVSAIDSFGQESTFATASATPDSPFTVDTLAPKTPTAINGTITTDINSSLTTKAQISWDWVTLNSDDTSLTDLAGYRVQYKKTADSSWSTVEVSPEEDNTTIYNLSPYVSYDFRVAAFDFIGNTSAYSSPITPTLPTNVAPSTPAAPTASSSTMRVQVTISGNKAAGGSMEADVDYYRVYASTTTGFTPAASNMLGTVENSPAMVATFNLPASNSTASATTQTWYIKIIAVDLGALTSAASAQATSTPGLIDTANIIDASITNAKISTLDVNKLTAGTGLINNLTVKSKLTIGESTSTNGSIESWNYAPGVSGLRIDRFGIEVNEGIIEAKALMLQNGYNMLSPAFADFEYDAEYYKQFFALPENNERFIAVGTTAEDGMVKYNRRALRIQSFINNTIIQQKDRIELEPDTDYIVSFYGKKNLALDYIQVVADWGLGAAPTNIGGWIYLESSYSRHSVTFTTPSALGADVGLGFAINLFSGVTLTDYPEPFRVESDVQYAVGADICIDGLQLEKRLTALNGPSTWKPPSTTLIDGAGITTGMIRSNARDEDTSQPLWSIDMEGDAVFSNLLIRKTTVVGEYRPNDDISGEDDMSSIQSYNFVPNESGWRMMANGWAEFVGAKISGELDMTRGSIGESLITVGYADPSSPSTTLRSKIQVDDKGKIILESGVQPPPIPPMYGPSWKTEVSGTKENDNYTLNGLWKDGSTWYTAASLGTANQIWQCSSSTGWEWEFVAGINSGIPDSKWALQATGGIVKQGSRWYVGGYLYNLGGAIAYAVFDTSFNRIGTKYHIIQNQDITGQPCLGQWSTSDLVIAYTLKSDSKTYFVVAAAQTASTHATISYTKWFRSLWRPGAGVNAVQRHISEDNVMVMYAGVDQKLVKFENVSNASSSSTLGGSYIYPAAYGYAVRGLHIISNTYYSLAGGGNVYTYSTDQGTDCWIRYQFESSTQATGLSPAQRITTIAGSWPKFSHNISYPSGSTKASFYAYSSNSGTVSNWKKQVEVAKPTKSVISSNPMNVSSGSAPITSKFTITTGGVIQSTSSTLAETFELKGDGTGIWPLKMRVFKGVITANFTSGTPKSVSITFSPPFKNIPAVVAVANINNPTSGSVSAGNTTVSGCDVFGVRTAGLTSDLNFSLIAMEQDTDYTRSGV